VRERACESRRSGEKDGGGTIENRADEKEEEVWVEKEMHW
jgi:hypothetical protein